MFDGGVRVANKGRWRILPGRVVRGYSRVVRDNLGLLVVMGLMECDVGVLGFYECSRVL